MLCEMEGLMNGQQLKRLFDKLYEPLMKQYGLKKIELEVLLFLNTYKAYDTAKDIVNFKCLSKAHVSKAIESLSKKGYISANCGEQDRRCMHLTITGQAGPVLTEMEKLWSEWENVIYEKVTREERELLKDVMSKIANNINNVLEYDRKS